MTPFVARMLKRRSLNKPCTNDNACRSSSSSSSSSFSDDFLRQVVGLPSAPGGRYRLCFGAGVTFANELQHLFSMRHRDESVVNLGVSAELIKTMAASFNDDITVATEPTINQNVINHVIIAAALQRAFPTPPASRKTERPCGQTFSVFPYDNDYGSAQYWMDGFRGF